MEENSFLIQRRKIKIYTVQNILIFTQTRSGLRERAACLSFRPIGIFWNFAAAQTRCCSLHTVTCKEFDSFALRVDM